MTRKDWLCPVCGDVMFCSNILNPKKYMVCFRDHGGLYPCFGIEDLPRAEKVLSELNFSKRFYRNSKTFVIKRNQDCLLPNEVMYEYVPHGHKAALDKAPAEGCVVASVAFRDRRAVRLFKRKRTLRECLREHHFQELGEAVEK